MNDPPPGYQDVAFVRESMETAEVRGYNFEHMMVARFEQLEAGQKLIVEAIAKMPETMKAVGERQVPLTARDRCPILRKCYDSFRMRLRLVRFVAFTPEEARVFLRLRVTSSAAARSLERGNPSTEEAAEAAEHRRRADWALEAFHSLAQCVAFGLDIEPRYKEICLAKPPYVGPLDERRLGAR